MKINRHIYLATTEGCEACKIMERILKQVQHNNVYTFSIQVRDHKFLPEFIRTDVYLTDFPTLIFLENDVIKYHVAGTISAKKLQEIIKDLHFN
uniref:Thioredoxin n=1 Tax=Geladintestivirus 5 TaxID=3233137 RepID=A0AAU8MJS8_9CAUD